MSKILIRAYLKLGIDLDVGTRSQKVVAPVFIEKEIRIFRLLDL